MHPPIAWQWIAVGDLDRVGRPHVREHADQAPVLDREFVAAACGVESGTRLVDQDGTVAIDWRVHPQRDRERLRARESTDLVDFDAVLAAEQQRAGVASVDRLRGIDRAPQPVTAHAVGELAAGDGVERERCDRARGFDVGVRRQPRVELRVRTA